MWPKVISVGCGSIKLVNKIEHRISHLLMIFVVLE